MPPNSSLRRTRFVCISDTHNSLPKLPPGDVLVHAGDLTNQGSLSELQKTVTWLEQAPFKCKLVVAGNHDITLDSSFYKEYGSRFHNKQPQDTLECIDLLKKSPSITYLNHEAKTISMGGQDGPQTTFKVFGSPYSPSRGLWAFGYTPEDAVALWERVPLDCDVVISHTPPKFHCDEAPSRGSAGCEALRQALWRVRPRLVVCGHVHESRGAETVLWDLRSPSIKYNELKTIKWKILDIGKKQTRVDLTSRSQCPLLNDGAVGNISKGDMAAPGSGRGQEIVDSGDPRRHSTRLPEVRPPSPPTFPGFENAENAIAPIPDPLTTGFPASQGQGRESMGGRDDTEVLIGREGRAETCIVNASVLGSSFPHPAGKRFWKPIVVDLELPIAN